MPESPAQFTRRNQIHAHNGLLGNVGIMRAHLKPILKGPMVTEEARTVAHQIELDLMRLNELLRTRRDQQDSGSESS